MNPIDDGTMQELVHQCHAHHHYARESFKKMIGGRVELGLLLRQHPRIAFQLEMDDLNVQTCIKLSQLLFDYADFSEEEWESLEGQWLDATITWTRALDNRLKPSKRYRAQMILRRFHKAIAAVALVSLRAQQEDES